MSEPPAIEGYVSAECESIPGLIRCDVTVAFEDAIGASTPILSHSATLMVNGKPHRPMRSEQNRRRRQ
jgi:hypothetical protein